MNFGLILRYALQRAELPFDAEHLDLARGYCNNNIQDLWYLVKADFRESSATINTVIGSDEYVLNKLFDGFLLNSLRGPSTAPRNLIYKDPTEFFRMTEQASTSTGNPDFYTFGTFSGCDAQPKVPTTVDVYSTLANKTTGTISIPSGSKLITGVGTNFSINDVGLRFQASGDNDSYEIAEWLSTTSLKLSTTYRGNTQSGAAYKIGDVGVHVNIQGYVQGEISSEDVTLDGNSVQTTSKNFSAISSVTKSSLTGGNVVARDSANTVNIAVLGPNEYEAERQTVRLWKIPDSVEALAYRFYMKHPILRMDTDRPFIPDKYHNLLQRMTEADLLEWQGKKMGEKLMSDIANGREKFIGDASDATLWYTIPRDEGLGYGYSNNYLYNSDPDFA